ncbi:AAA family ATPase [Agromyces fucosus]|uniref:AAA family ATPase n=1 Tax=Agromyces fucosus TaxID=41985 RepID=UPI001404BCE4|nr:AAA family ATPase [Agromyces fucosus]
MTAPAARTTDLAPTAILVVGAPASGKSTVGRLLAERLRPGAFIEGDTLWQMVVGGREDMADPPSDAALAQLELRYRHGAMLSRSFVEAGISAVHVDNIFGDGVTAQLDRMPRRRALVVLRPSVEAIVRRETERGTGAYDGWIGDDTLADAVRTFDGWVGEVPPVGLWVDSTEQTAEQTVDWIVDRLDSAIVG